MAGTITLLEVQKRNKERVNVYLDGEYAFSLAAIEAARLHKGQRLTDDDIAALRADDALQRATDDALRFLSHRPRSISEVHRNLAQKGLEPAVIDAAIARLEKLGYVDDLAFARYWVANREEFNPKGPLALRYELRQKGVASAIIDQVMDEVDFAETAYRAAQRHAAHLHNRPLHRLEFQQKTYQYLARRGFTAEIVEDAIARLLEESDLPDPHRHDNDVVEE